MTSAHGGNVRTSSLFELTLSELIDPRHVSFSLLGTLPPSLQNEMVRLLLRSDQFVSFEAFPFLSSLIIRIPRPNHYELHQLVACPHLTHVVLNAHNQLDFSLFAKVLPSFFNLQTLDLKGCRNLTPDCFADLPDRMPELQSLVLDECKKLGDETLIVAFQCPLLTALSMHGLRLSNGGISAAIQSAKCVNLRGLGLSMASKVTDLGLERLFDAENPFRLQNLEVNHLFNVNRFPPQMLGLVSLDVSGCNKLACDQPEPLRNLAAFKADFCDNLKTLDALPSTLQKFEMSYCKVRRVLLLNYFLFLFFFDRILALSHYN
jgi:hypothetical protein